MKFYTVDDYCKLDCVNHFTTAGSIIWEIKQHRNDLILAGVLINGAGRRATLVREDFEPEALRLLQERQQAIAATGQKVIG